jgi:hypothetical protein
MFLESNENEYPTYHNLWNTAKAVLKGDKQNSKSQKDHTL